MASPLTYIDMKLPAKKKPASLSTLGKDASMASHVDKHWRSIMDTAQAIDKEKLAKMRYSYGKEGNVYASGNVGLFDAVHTAWANHWKLRTCPEDWWQPVIRYVAKLIFSVTEAKPEGKVKKLFVGDQQGKKQLVVKVPQFRLEDVDFKLVFNKFAEKIEENVLVPEFKQAMTADFSTSGYEHIVGSQITLMSATQNFFEFVLMLCGCGIKGVEMQGTLEDWRKLRKKLKEIQDILDPVKDELEYFDRGYSKWMHHVDFVFTKLAETFENKASAVNWWPKILINSTQQEWGPSGMSSTTVKAYDGWLIKFLTGMDKIGKNKIGREIKGLSTVPMKLVDLPNEKEDDSILVAGILGYTIVESSKSKSEIPTVQANHLWSLHVTADSHFSPFRS